MMILSYNFAEKIRMLGMDDKDVRRIMGVTQEAIRSTRHRIQQNTKK